VRRIVEQEPVEVSKKTDRGLLQSGGIVLLGIRTYSKAWKVIGFKQEVIMMMSIYKETISVSTMDDDND